jgi:hypothetical protein
MRWLALAPLLLALPSCSLSSFVTSETVDYNGAIESANNQLLLANILRARDRVPLYFSDLSQIRGSMSLTTTDALTIPFGPQKVSPGKRYSDLLTQSIQSAPTFDVIPLNQQEFTQGLVQPLELQYGKYYWDRLDFPEFMLASLFVDKVEIERPGAPPHFVPNLPETQTEFDQLLQNWEITPDEKSTDRKVSFHGYTGLMPIGNPTPLGSQSGLKDLAALDPTKFRVEYKGPRSVLSEDQRTSQGPKEVKQDTYQLYAVEERIVICPPQTYLKAERDKKFDIYLVAPQILGSGNDKTIRVTPHPADACSKSEMIDLQPAAAEVAAERAEKITIYSRSVEGIIQYLGAVLRTNQPTNPIKFYVRKAATANARISLTYQDGTYYVGPDSSDDHTLQILALLEQLLNLRKNSKEITTTTAVQSVP